MDFRDRSRLNAEIVSDNRGCNFETLRSLMSWDTKTRKKSSSFNTTDGKSKRAKTKFLRIYVKSHNTHIPSCDLPFDIASKHAYL